ncbi:MAG: glycosyl hydrolase, partial [Phycisphaeraceae bacterium]
NGYGPMTFPLTMAEDGLLDIHVVEGDKPNAEYSGKDGKAIREIVLDHLKTKGIDGSKETVLIFCNLTKWDPAERRISHHSPYYAGGSHQAGTAWQLDSVLLDVGQIGNINKEQYVHDGQYGHISLGRYQSIFVGGICHELGHALGLPHNKERTEEKQRWGTALMGSGNFTYSQESRDGGKGSFLTFAHATKLASHPAFSGSMKQMRANPQTAYHELSMDITNNGTDVRIKGKVTGKIPVYAVIAYLDPEGGSDYNATSHAAVTDNDGRFTIDCTSFAGKQGRIRLVAIHANGWSRFSEDVGVNYTRDIHGKIGLDESALNSRKMDFGDIDTTGDVAACTHCKRK